MSLVMMMVLIIVAALFIFGVVANLDMTTDIMTAASFDIGNFLIGSFIILLVIIVAAFALTYKT